MLSHARQTLESLWRYVLVSVVVISQIINALEVGEECGDPPTKRYMEDECGKLICSLCKMNEYWDIDTKRCSACTGNFTNLNETNAVRCKDKRPSPEEAAVPTSNCTHIEQERDMWRAIAIVLIVVIFVIFVIVLIRVLYLKYRKPRSSSGPEEIPLSQ